MSGGASGLTRVWHRVLVLIASISVGASRWSHGWCCHARVCTGKNKDLLSLRATLQHCNTYSMRCSFITRLDQPDNREPVYAESFMFRAR